VRACCWSASDVNAWRRLGAGRLDVCACVNQRVACVHAAGLLLMSMHRGIWAGQLHRWVFVKV
jgi:hypothetical protein